MRFAPWLAIALLAACGSEQSSTSSSLTRAPGACGGFETHVIGVYDPGTGTTAGGETIYLARPGKHALVLSAYGATTWHVSVAPGATLEHVYAVGYHHQIVDAPAALDVLTDSYVDNGVYANGYAYPDADTRHLLELAATRVHHEATSFHGCHTATSWTIGEDLGTSSDCDTQYTQSDAILTCSPSGGSGSCGTSGSGSSAPLQ